MFRSIRTTLSTVPDQTKSNAFALPALVTGLVLMKKAADQTGWNTKLLKGSTFYPIYRQNKVITAVYFGAVGVQYFFAIRGIVRDLKAAEVHDSMCLCDDCQRPASAYPGTSEELAAAIALLDDPSDLDQQQASDWDQLRPPRAVEDEERPMLTWTKLVGVDSETEVRLCQQGGHGGEEIVLNKDGSCPFNEEHDLADVVFTPLWARE